MWAEDVTLVFTCPLVRPLTDHPPPCPRAQRLLTNFCVSLCLLKLEASFSERTSGPMSNQTDIQKHALIRPSSTQTNILVISNQAWKHQAMTFRLTLNAPLHKWFVSKSRTRPPLCPRLFFRPFWGDATLTPASFTLISSRSFPWGMLRNT